MECISCGIADVEESQSSQSLDGTDNPRGGAIIEEECNDIDPQSDKHDAIDDAPGASVVGVRSEKYAIGNHLDDRFNSKDDCKDRIDPDKPVARFELVRLPIDLLIQRSRHTSENHHGDNGGVYEG